jgi:alkanesulfonate monooxygenase SsuD/methylene tetrahydromethanopterin reductase-like flavin-dependent oxidoreductase (luciferase family)
VVRPAVRRGAAKAGRPPEDVAITSGVILQISADRELAQREAALQVAFYATTRTYRPVLELHGFGHLVEPLRRAFAQKDFAAMADLAMPMVDTLAVAGPPDECRERVETFAGEADRIILGGTWIGPAADRLAENQRAIMETFAPTR